MKMRISHSREVTRPNGAMRSAACGSLGGVQAALTAEPSKEYRMKKLPSNSSPRDWRDLVAFLAVLTTGVLLILLGHVTSGGLTTVCAALVGLYATWKHFRP